MTTPYRLNKFSPHENDQAVLYNPLPDISEKEFLAHDRNLKNYRGRTPLSDTPVFRVELSIWENQYEDKFVLNPGQERVLPRKWAEHLYRHYADQGVVLYDLDTPDEEKEAICEEGIMRAMNNYAAVGTNALDKLAIKFPGERWEMAKYSNFPGLCTASLKERVLNEFLHKDHQAVPAKRGPGRPAKKSQSAAQ